MKNGSRCDDRKLTVLHCHEQQTIDCSKPVRQQLGKWTEPMVQLADIPLPQSAFIAIGHKRDTAAEHGQNKCTVTKIKHSASE